MQEKLRVGRITATHGLKGELKVYPTTDNPDRFLELSRVYLDYRGIYRELTIEKVRFFKQLVIVKFEGLDRIEDVMDFRQLDLYVAREDAKPLAEDEWYIGDIIGMEVFTEDGQRLGVIRDVLQNGANDNYIVKTEGKDVLIPAIRQCICEVSLADNRMTVHLLDGLLDL